MYFNGIYRMMQARSQPSDNEGGGYFPQILDLFQSLKIGSSQCLSGENLDFYKLIMTDDVTLWLKLKST